jgi:hypothetical protein
MKHTPQYLQEKSENPMIEIVEKVVAAHSQNLDSVLFGVQRVVVDLRVV